MYEETGLFFSGFRMLFVGVAAIAFLISAAALITAIGADTALNPQSHTAIATFDTASSDSPNAVTAGTTILLNGAEQALITTGTILYGACRNITTATMQGGRLVAHASVAALRGIGDGMAIGARGVGHGALFLFRTASTILATVFQAPGRLTTALTHGQNVSTLIRPADAGAVPTIPAGTSATLLAHLSAQRQRQISQLITAQLAANQRLGGTIVAGDPHHGGYPAKWDTAAQDNTTDSWGMYNRECVSYAAWKVYQTYGDMPFWGGVGNANEWPGDARRAGIATGTTPCVHSVAISMRGYYGHAMWVEAVKGNMIYVSQYNYDLHGHYSEMWVNSAGLTYIYFQ